ncbi:MAG TPA: DUF5937 family protein, partial [Micromonosporaceae bacterium]|nr:DUF5937 family protein [Micromonosporaceae bacterium]
MTELVNALMMLQRRDNPLYDPWRKAVWSHFPSAAKPLLDLVLPTTAPDYLDSFSPTFEEGLDDVMSASHALEWSAFDSMDRRPTLLARRLADSDPEARSVLRSSVTAAHQAVFGPLWSRVAATHHDDLASRQQTLITEGIGAVLAGLFPGAEWNGPILEIGGRPDRDVKLDGHGITLAPSTFWTGPPLVGRGVPGQPLLIVYQARIALPLIDAPDDSGRKLGPLLGR